MANRPANAGAHSAGPQQRPQQRPPQRTQQRPPQGPAAAPPPVHHQDYPRSRRAAAAKAAQAARPASQVVAWLPYLIVLAGTAAGLLVASSPGSRQAGRGAAVVGAALLVAALARLALPPRYAGLLASRSKAQDVAGFAVFGAAVLAVAASLP
jgi:DUF3017 family protein